MTGPQVAGQPAAIRLSQQISQYARLKDTPPPNADQIWMVMHALADHTAIMEALKHRPDPTSPWPEATSIGRWLQDVGDQAEGML